MAKWKRYVVGPDANGKSAALMHEATNVQEDPNCFTCVTGEIYLVTDVDEVLLRGCA